MQKSMVSLFTLLAILVASTFHNVFAGVSFTDGEHYVEFTDDGDMVTNLAVEQQSNSLPSGSLVFEKDNAPQISIGTTSVGLKGSLAENLISDPIAGELALFDLINSPVAVFSTIISKTLAIIGNNNGDFIPTSAVVYAGDAVFIDNSGEMTLSYKNVGSEGKVTYDKNLTPQEKYFYTKDHLGSTRMVVSGDAVVTSAHEYKAYGEIVPLLFTTDGDGKAREMFTGKELDQEGAKRGSQIKNYIKLNDGISTNSGYSVQYRVTFTDGTFQEHDLQYYISGSPYEENYYILDNSDFYETSKSVKEVALVFYHRYLPYDGIWYKIPLVTTVNIDKSRTISLTKNFSDIYPTQTESSTPINYFTTTSEVAFAGTPGIALDYFGARYYDPVVGVWGTTDPMDQFWNSYSYTGGNPINLIDPDGMQAKDEDDELENLEDYEQKDWEITKSYMDENGVINLQVFMSPADQTATNTSPAGGSASGEGGNAPVKNTESTGDASGCGGSNAVSNNGTGGGLASGGLSFGGAAGWMANRAEDAGEEFLSNSAGLSFGNQSQYLTQTEELLGTYKTMRNQGLTIRGPGGGKSYHKRMIRRLTKDVGMRKIGVESAKRLAMLSKGLPIVGIGIGVGIDVGTSELTNSPFNLQQSLWSNTVSAGVGIGVGLAAAAFLPATAPIGIAIGIGIGAGWLGDKIGNTTWGWLPE